MRALQDNLLKRKNITLEPLEQKTAMAYLRACACADLSLLPTQVDDSLHAGARDIYSNVLVARETYAAYAAERLRAAVAAQNAAVSCVYINEQA